MILHTARFLCVLYAEICINATTEQSWNFHHCKNPSWPIQCTFSATHSNINLLFSGRFHHKVLRAGSWGTLLVLVGQRFQPGFSERSVLHAQARSECECKWNHEGIPTDSRYRWETRLCWASVFYSSQEGMFNRQLGIKRLMDNMRGEGSWLTLEQTGLPICNSFTPKFKKYILPTF